MNIDGLRADREARVARLNEMLPANSEGTSVPEGEAPIWTAELQVEYDRLVGEVEKIDAEIRRGAKVQALTDNVPDAFKAAEEAAIKASAAGSEKSVDELAAAELQHRRNFADWAKTGMVDGKGVNCITATLDRGTDGDGFGGRTFADDFRASLVEIQRAFGGIRTVADVQNVADGRKITVPVSNPTSLRGYIVEEGTADNTNREPSFTQESVEFDRWASGEVALTVELAQDTQIDLLGYVNRVLGQNLARAQAEAFTVGTTTPAARKVRGVVEGATQAGNDIAAVGGNAALSFDNLLELIHALDPAYREPSSRFAFNDSTLLRLRRVKAATGEQRPLWVPDTNSLDGGRIWGYPYIILQEMDDVGDDNTPVLFGNFNYYKIFDAMNVEVHRFDSPAYVKSGTIGFYATQRSAGRMMDGGAGAVRFLRNA